KGLGVDQLRAKLDTWFAPALAHLIEEDEQEIPASDEE
ncbi:YihA family ribosome biogenesis GTP-binding protein, partial [Vibrio parahaemolyticus]|nr:YihA family ribosome biogenesis GTP-binding protein [Vibrio parahaemolyticus]